MKEGYLRVTEVLAPFSGLKDIDPQILANAGSRGSVVHRLCDYHVEHIHFSDKDINEMIRKYAVVDEHFEKEKCKVLDLVISFQKWAEGKEFIVKPDRLYCDEHMITGEIDLIYKNEDGLTLVDLKTPANESKTWMLQATGYWYLAKQAGINLQNIQFVKLSRTGGKPKVFEYKPDFDLFLSVLKTYRYFYAGESVKEIDLDYL